jgi:hypothetical protein
MAFEVLYLVGIRLTQMHTFAVLHEPQPHQILQQECAQPHLRESEHVEPPYQVQVLEQTFV